MKFLVCVVLLLILNKAFGVSDPENESADDDDDDEASVVFPNFLDPFGEKNREKNEIDWNEADHRTIMARLQHDIFKQITGKVPFMLYGPGNHVPVKNASQTLMVKFHFSVQRIESIDEKHQKVVLLGHVHLSWNDSYVSWDPNEYRNISVIKMVPYSMWVPPLHSSAHMETIREPHPTGMISSKGECHYSSVVRLSLFCPDMDYSNFPYDTHTCEVLFYLNHPPSSNLPGIHLKFLDESDSNMNFDMVHPHMMKNISLEWHIISLWKHTETHRLEGKVLWSHLEYWFQYRRNFPYFGLLFVLPVVVATVCLILMFTFPIESPVRLGVALGSFVFLSLVYARIFDHLPPVSNSTPKIVQFYGLTFVLGLFAVLESVILDRTLNRIGGMGKLPPPRLFQTTISIIGRLLCYWRASNYAKSTPDQYVELVESDQGRKPVGVGEEESEVRVKGQSGHVTWEDVIRVSDSLVFFLLSVVFVLGAFALLR